MMKVLVATAEGQGTREGDYCWALEGELVLAGPLLECCEPATCGCGRGFPGLASARATTTAMVGDRPELGPGDLRRAIRDSLDRQGWLGNLQPGEDEALVEAEAELVQRAAAAFPAGAVLSRAGDRIWQRLDVAA
jgi:hypothetical protein